MSVVQTLCVFVGFVVYAKYKDCDPLTSHKISKHDQIFPYFVTDISTSVPGISGFFLAAISSGSLRYIFPFRKRYTKIYIIAQCLQT